MNKYLLPALLALVLPLGAQAMGGTNGMSAKQQEMCRKACMMRGDKYDPTSSANSKGCTCLSDEGENYTITDADQGQMNLDNVVGKANN